MHKARALFFVCSGLLLLALSLPSVVRAGSIEIQLTGLLGTYAGGQNKTASFGLGAPLDTVSGGAIHLVGWGSPGWSHGDGTCGDPNIWVSQPAALTAWVDPSEPGTRRAQPGSLDGQFDTYTPFDPGTSDWSSILDGTGSVRLSLAGYGCVCCVFMSWPQATVTAASLILDTLRTTVDADVPGDASLAFALDPVCPNPSRGGALTVAFTLPTDAPARLELLDIAGRRVATHEVVGSGGHTLDLAANRPLAPGLYLARLAQGANTKTTRVVVLK